MERAQTRLLRVLPAVDRVPVRVGAARDREDPERRHPDGGPQRRARPQRRTPRHGRQGSGPQQCSTRRLPAAGRGTGARVRSPQRGTASKLVTACLPPGSVDNPGLRARRRSGPPRAPAGRATRSRTRLARTGSRGPPAPPSATACSATCCSWPTNCTGRRDRHGGTGRRWRVRRRRRWAQQRMTTVDYDLIVIGGGAAGLGTARAPVRAGARMLLASDGPPGGDCTFSGCVPSKTLIEAAKQAQPFPAAAQRIRDVIAQIAATEDAAEVHREGIDVTLGRARFTGPGRIRADGRVVTARRFVIATGVGPLIPPIPGLDQVPYLTNETVFDLSALPASLAVLGGGAIGCELAQAFARLGSRCLRRRGRHRPVAVHPRRVRHGTYRRRQRPGPPALAAPPLPARRHTVGHVHRPGGRPRRDDRARGRPPWRAGGISTHGRDGPGAGRRRHRRVHQTHRRTPAAAAHPRWWADPRRHHRRRTRRRTDPRTGPGDGHPDVHRTARRHPRLPHLVLRGAAGRRPVS